MKIRVLGGHGGRALGFETTSFLIDSKLLIDAGAVAGTLTVEEQCKIENILISHIHLDHIKDLAFISDNCFGLRALPFYVFTHQTVKTMIKQHLLNDIIWPDFTLLPTVKNPIMTITAVEPEKTFEVSKYQVTPVKVKHAYDAMGFFVDNGESSVLFTLDTGPTDRIWEVAHSVPNLKAIFTEVSFPNSLQKVADLSDHHTSKSIRRELLKMPPDIPVILTHMKPNYRDVVAQEIKAIGDSRVRILDKDGEIFEF
jgi:ribonuclease BN (tRNA processing enzyme)